MELVKLNDVRKSYIKTSYNLTINGGEIIIVTGINGSGKSTLLKLIMGLIRIDSGRITKKKGLKMSYLPEKADLPLHLKVIDYWSLITKLDYYPNPEILYRFNIPLFKEIGKLSKGNMQKLAILSTFLHQSELIILDEPLSGLDKKSHKIVTALIKEAKENMSAVVISTHSKTVFNRLSPIYLEL